MNDDASHLGLLQIEDYSFAIPARDILQVRPRPVVARIPNSGPLGTGAIQLGGQTIPAFDVASFLTGVCIPPKARSLLAILQHDGRTLGLEIDAVGKVFERQENSRTELTAQAASGQEMSPLFPQSFWDEDLDRPIGIMDLEALLDHPGMRFVRMNTAPSEVSTESAVETVNLALFIVKGLTFAVDISYVRAALHPGKINPVGFDSEVLYGHYVTEERHTPIFRIVEYLQLPSRSETNPLRSLIIGGVDGKESQDLAAGFLIDDVAGTIAVRVSDIHSLERSGMRETELYRGILPTPERGHVVVLNPEAILIKLGVRRSLKNHTPGATSVEANNRQQALERPFVIYRAGPGFLASPLHEIEAIVPLRTFFPLGRPGDAFAGVMPWCGRSLNLLNLPALVGDTQATGESCRDVLITELESNGSKISYGFLVTRVESMSSATREVAPILNRPVVQALGEDQNALLFGEMIRTQVAGAPRHYAVLDLKQLARIVMDGALSV